MEGSARKGTQTQLPGAHGASRAPPTVPSALQPAVRLICSRQRSHQGEASIGIRQDLQKLAHMCVSVRVGMKNLRMDKKLKHWLTKETAS